MKNRLKKRRKHEKGQAIVESTMCLLMICLILFGLLQIFYLYVAQVILDYSAFCTARGAAVGLYGRYSDGGDAVEEGYILKRAMRVAAIGASGDLLTGEDGGGTPFSPDGNPLSQFGWEREQIPWYLQWGWYLGYEYWDDMGDPEPETDNNCVRVRVGCEYPVDFPMKSAFFQSDTLDIQGEAAVMDYAVNYLQ